MYTINKINIPLLNDSEISFVIESFVFTCRVIRIEANVENTSFGTILLEFEESDDFDQNKERFNLTRINKMRFMASDRFTLFHHSDSSYSNQVSSIEIGNEILFKYINLGSIAITDNRQRIVSSSSKIIIDIEKNDVYVNYALMNQIDRSVFIGYSESDIKTTI